MSATARPLPSGAPRVRHLPLAGVGRLLALELRHNVMLWMAPLIALLFYFDAYHIAMGFAALWSLRASVLPSHLLLNCAPFVAGGAAWMSSREGRRHTTDLVAIAARPRWLSQLFSWAATTAWALLIYLGCVAVLYGVTASQATWGGPPWWPVAAGATGVAACSALGFAIGSLLPGRFTAPLVALGALLVLTVGFHLAVGQTKGYDLISPINQDPAVPIGVFTPYLPDLFIAQVMFLGGLAVAALGAMGLRRAAGGPWLRRIAAVVAICGLAATGTALGLTGSARRELQGVVIPALHDAASDKPITYTPVSSGGAIPILVHPAFHDYLPDLEAALKPVLAELAGVPGAPISVDQVAGSSQSGRPILSGDPPVFDFTIGQIVAGRSPYAGATGQAATRLAFIDTVLIGSSNLRGPGVFAGPPGVMGSPAQQAVEAVLLKAAGVPLVSSGQPQPGSVSGPAPGTPTYAAAQRFSALSPAARHAWLATHLIALQTGKVKVAQVP
jgi:hypothetical protein